MDERGGRAVLRDRFEAAGLSIIEDHRLEIDGHVLIADGFDPARGVGYEFLTREAGDDLAVGPELVAALEGRARAGDIIVFLVDEDEVGDAAELGELADRFLAELRARGRLS